MLLDAGNSLTGDMPPATSTMGGTSVEAMNRMNYDGMALALEDLALGVEVLQTRMREAKFPFLSANVFIGQSKQLFAQPYVVLEMGGRRVALIGITEAGEVAGFTIADPLAAAQKMVAEVSKQADIIIVLTHASVSAARQIATQAPGIDVVICGGSEVLPAGEMTSSGALLVHADVAAPGHAGRNLGIISAHFDSQGRLVQQSNTIIPLSETLPEDPEMAAWVQQVSQ